MDSRAILLGGLMALAATTVVLSQNAQLGGPNGPNAAAQFKAGKSGQLAALELPRPEEFSTPDGRKGWRIKIPGGRPLATPAVVGGVLYVGGGFGSHEFYAINASTGKLVWGFKTGDDGPTAAVVDEDCVVYNTESCTIYIHDAKTGKVLWDKWLGDPLMSQPAIAGGRLFMAYPGQGGHHLVCFKLRTGEVIWDQPIDAEIISAPVIDGDGVFVATCGGTLYHFDQASGRLYWSKKYNVTSAPIILNGKPYFSQRAVKTLEMPSEDGKAGGKKTSEVTVEGFNAADAKTGELAFKEPLTPIKAAYLLSLNNGRMQFAANSVMNTTGQTFNRVEAGKAAGVILTATQPQASASSSVDAREVLKRLKAYQEKPVSDKADAGLKDAQEAKLLADDVEKVADALAKRPNQDKAVAELRKSVTEIRAQAGKVKEASETIENIQSNLKATEKEAQAAQKHDSSVAFSTAPAAAKLSEAASNLGQGNVKSVWAFQGSRPLPYKDTFVVVQGDQFRAVDQKQDKAIWENKITSKVDATRPATPPALAGGKVFFGTADGRIVCADPETGKTLWESQVGGHILFQPAVVEGQVYVATDDGTLICLQTGDDKANGWAMWGGSAKHNGQAVNK